MWVSSIDNSFCFLEDIIYGSIKTIIYWVPAACQNLPILNLLPYLEFNKLVPNHTNIRRKHFKKFRPTNSKVFSLLKQPALWFLIYYLNIRIIPVRLWGAKGRLLSPELISRSLFILGRRNNHSIHSLNPWCQSRKWS